MSQLVLFLCSMLSGQTEAVYTSLHDWLVRQAPTLQPATQQSLCQAKAVPIIHCRIPLLSSAYCLAFIYAVELADANWTEQTGQASNRNKALYLMPFFERVHHFF